MYKPKQIKFLFCFLQFEFNTFMYLMKAIIIKKLGVD